MVGSGGGGEGGGEGGGVGGGCGGGGGGGGGGDGGESGVCCVRRWCRCIVLSVVVIVWLVGSDRVLISVGWRCQSINIKKETIFWDTQYL